MLEKLKNLKTIYYYSFFVSAHIALIVYVGSTFLSSIFGQEYIWVIYSVAAFFTLLLNFTLTNILRKVDILRLNNFVLYFAFLNLILLWYSSYPAIVFLTYIIYIVLGEYLTTISNIIVEDLSKDSVTGSIRGTFITMQSLGYLVAPFFASFIIKFYGLPTIFLISSLFILVSIIYLKSKIKTLPKISIHDKNLLDGVKHIYKNFDLRISFLSFTALNLFYISAVVYIPFKMESVNISLDTYLSLLLPIALTTFLFIPKYLGHLEDKFKDEKQFLIFGNIGLILILFFFAFTGSNSILLWACILFMSRIFASTVETSVNSYFYKKIDQSNTAIISIFSSANQLAYLIFSPILGLLLFYGNLETVFLSISFFLCFVLVLISKIHNTENYEKHKLWKEIYKRSKNRRQGS